MLLGSLQQISLPFPSLPLAPTIPQEAPAAPRMEGRLLDSHWPFQGAILALQTYQDPLEGRRWTQRSQLA